MSTKREDFITTGLKTSDDCWEFSEDEFLVSENRKIEGLFCQGSGYLHVRASLEERLSDAQQNREYMRMPANVTAEKFPAVKSKWGTYITGIYGKHPFLNNQIINLPAFFLFTISCGGERLCLETSRCTGYSRKLSLLNGLLSRSFDWHPKNSSSKITIKFERFASTLNSSLFVQRIVIKSDAKERIEVLSEIDADVRTNGFDHFRDINFSHSTNSHTQCRVTTDAGDLVTVESFLSGAQWEFSDGQRISAAKSMIELEPGREVVIEKRSVFSTSRDDTRRIEERAKGHFPAISFDDLLVSNNKDWKQRWENCDIKISGHSKAQAAIRISQYHLLRAAPRDAAISIDAKGYAGEGYFGRFFWDSEIYLIPYFLYTDPVVAANLIDYRINTVEGAKRTAKKQGYKGARYAWEADALGDECCALWQYRDHEIHITADVVYALIHVSKVFNDDSLFYDKARQVALETARYWIDRVDQIGTPEVPSLVGVMGPDEYQPLGSNNAYTNKMVRFTLAHCLKYAEKIGLSSDEIAKVKNIVANLPIPRRSSDGVVLQSDDFEKLANPRFDERWKDREACYAAQVPQELLYRSKNLKQADVLMMMYLFPDDFNRKEVADAFEYYEPLTTHDSSLSCAIHSIVASRLGNHVGAWEYFEKGAYIDLDFTHDGPAEGIHIAAAAGNWLVLMQGFLGMYPKMNSEILKLNPYLPKALERIEANLIWNSVPLKITLAKDECIVTNKGSDTITVEILGTKLSVAAGVSQKLDIKVV